MTIGFRGRVCSAQVNLFFLLTVQAPAVDPAKMRHFALFLAVILQLGVGFSYPTDIKQSSPGKVFLLGGAMRDTTASVFEAMREATGKAQPKIAVAISASSK